MTGVLFVLLAAAAAPIARIDDAAWLAGRWVGDGLGGTVEESWAPPAGGQMVGHFRLIKNGQVEFYEMMLIDVSDTGLRLRVKHFRPDFVGWEEKDGWHSFAPRSSADGDLRFDGLTIRRDGEAAIATVTIRNRDGTIADFPVRMRRSPL